MKFRNGKDRIMTSFIKTAAVTLALLVFNASMVIAQGNVVITGSTTVLPIAQVTLEAYIKANPGVNISLSGTGSGDGIKALIDKTTDIANSSRNIKESETANARKSGVNPREFIVAIDAIIPIIHPTNPITNLTIDQLSQIYQGNIRNWKEVGGEDRAIVVVSRDSSSGTYESWSELVLKKQRVFPRAQLQASSGAVVQTVTTNPYAIAYVGLGYLNPSVKPLKVNGVEPSVETAMTGKYPIARPLYMYTDGEPSGETAKYLQFILSPEGQKLVENSGFVPVGK